MTPLDPTLLSRLKALHANATPGPWAWYKCGKDWLLWAAHGIREIVLDNKKGFRVRDDKRCLMIPFDPSHPDMVLIVELRNAWPALLAHIEAQDARITALESDAEVDAQLIRDKDAEIERLKARIKEDERAPHWQTIDETAEMTPEQLEAVKKFAATRQPPADDAHGCDDPNCAHEPSRQPLREMPECVQLMIDGARNYHADCPHCQANADDVERHYSPRGGEGEGG